MTPGYQSAYTYQKAVHLADPRGRIETPEEQAERELQAQISAILAIQELYRLSAPLELRALLGVPAK